MVRLRSPTLGGQGERGKTRETGEEFDLFRRLVAAFNGTEKGSKNRILTGLTGLADRTPRHIEWLTSGKKHQGRN